MPDLNMAAENQQDPPAFTSEFQFIALSQVEPSPTNPRKLFDGPEFDELVASVRQRGILQPILVRPNYESHENEFEIVCGERRFRAAKAAGLEVIPAIIRELGDMEVREIQIIENLQRKDVSALEEANGLSQLLHALQAEQPDSGQKEIVQTIAQKIGKSVRHVYSRLALLELIEEVQSALANGDISASHADLFVPLDEIEQGETLAWMLAQPDEVSVRGLKAHIAAAYPVTYHIKDEEEARPAQAQTIAESSEDSSYDSEDVAEAEHEDESRIDVDEPSSEPEKKLTPERSAEISTKAQEDDAAYAKREQERGNIAKAFLVKAEQPGFDVCDLLAASSICDGLDRVDCQRISDLLGWKLSLSAADDPKKELLIAYSQHRAKDRHAFIAIVGGIDLSWNDAAFVDGVLRGYGMDPAKVRAGEFEVEKKKPSKSAKQKSAKLVKKSQKPSTAEQSPKPAKSTKKSSPKAAKKSAKKGGK